SERAKQALEWLQREAAKMMQQARIEAESIVTHTRANAERLREELKQKAKDEADNILRNAQQQIQLQTRQAIQQICREVADMAVLLTSKLLERNIAKEDNKRLIDDTLKQIEVTKQ